MFSFYKMQATGNDFIILDNSDGKLEYSYKLLSKYLCDRHFGVGADGVLIVERSVNSDAKMRIFNYDGSEAEMCGNGIRCFVRYLYEKRLIKKENMNIETKSGIRKVKLKVEYNTITNIGVHMGSVSDNKNDIPVYYEDEYNNKLNIEGLICYPVSIGNPHLVVEVENLDKFDVSKYGKILENYKYFPNKINVEFVEKISDEQIKIRVWERGVGETLSCGTGSCASAWVFNKYFSTNSDTIVELQGGILRINIKQNEIVLNGNSEYVYKGLLNI